MITQKKPTDLRMVPPSDYNLGIQHFKKANIRRDHLIKAFKHTPQGNLESMAKITFMGAQNSPSFPIKKAIKAITRNITHDASAPRNITHDVQRTLLQR